MHDRPTFQGAALRDPRRVNHVTHLGYTDAASSRDKADMSLEDWLESFPGRVESVKGGKLYVVRLGEQDGELKLGLVQSEGKVFSKDDEEGQPADFMKALWFRRCGVDPKKCNDEKNFAWPKKPAFELYMSSSGRIADDLEVKSFLLEVEDADLTEAGLAQKLKTPKFTEAFVKKLRMLAEKYELRGQPSTGSASAASSSGSTVASGSAKSGGEKDGGEKGNRASSSNGKASKGEAKSQKRAVSLPHATAQSGATEPKSQKPSKRSRR